ncbi:stealth family protein [Pseudomonas sp.]|uniref:stealth family protein n=1 Tax=Pseudomonas sp. TaxID=306 RepID=UPI002731CBB2|nr:stealth family protein [Pseudomonas sp.]MDP2242659.1 stealth family protein [Pseudomonas sp.]
MDVDSSTRPQPFDVVITWVNGADPLWRAIRALHQGEVNQQQTLSTSNVEGRFRDNGELRYLLYSLRAFCTGLRRIFLVTAGQRPHFLDEFPEVELVDHRDFIAAEYLPTFSSRAIEASLHLIPGIAEHFVAFNDDVFLMRPADFADFFGTLGCVVYLTDEALPASSDAQTLSGYNDALNARRWMLEHYGRSSVNRIMEHAPRGVRKSWMDKLEQRHPQMFAEVREEKFRRSSGQSILANLYGDWCLSQGRGEVRNNQCAYLFTDALEQSPAQVAEFIAADVLGRKLSLCINDQGDDRELKRVPQALRMVMENLFTEVA